MPKKNHSKTTVVLKNILMSKSVRSMEDLKVS